METLKLNGVERQYASGQMPATLAALLADLGVDGSAVVAEVDGAIVPAAGFAETPVAAGQSIELIKFMGGG
ncbi:MAG: sulfur carrier protein ThiS [Sedimentisphaerales bacterium]|nr:sulfur carrier protein ThiS [Sedimentisphaerales bacterium]